MTRASSEKTDLGNHRSASGQVGSHSTFTGTTGNAKSAWLPCSWVASLPGWEWPEVLPLPLSTLAFALQQAKVMDTRVVFEVLSPGCHQILSFLRQNRLLISSSS